MASDLIKCMNCGKPIQQTPGKRAKKFCDVTCRSGYWQKGNRNKKETKKTTPKKNGSKKSRLAKTAANMLESETVAGGIIFTDEQGKILEVIAVPIKTPNIFMGEIIPEGLTGIDLTIWKAEVKERCSKLK